MEGAILVVSVNDGPQVQTREHIILAKEVGITHIVVYINKLDALVELEMKELVELEIRELLDRYNFLTDLPVFKSYSDIDSNVDERTRGITINAFHGEYETKLRHYSYIDVQLSTIFCSSKK